MTGRDEYVRRLQARLAEVADGRELEAIAQGKPVPKSVAEIRALVAEKVEGGGGPMPEGVGARMSPAEERLLSFVDKRLESMLCRSAIWGSLLSVEDQILQLLEVRCMLLIPSFSADDTHKLLRAYSRFIAENLEDATVEPLATQLEQRGLTGDFPALMKKFADSVVAAAKSELATARAAGHCVIHDSIDHSTPGEQPHAPLLHWALMTHDLTSALGHLASMARHLPRGMVTSPTERPTLDLAVAAIAFTIQLAIETEDPREVPELRALERKLIAHMRMLGARVETAGTRTDDR